MGVRGRPSSVALSIVSPDAITAKRPEPPNYLGKEESEVWRKVTSCLPPDWFAEDTHGMLEQYCRHVICARYMAKRINKIQSASGNISDKDIKALDNLYKLQHRETIAIAALSTKMRITQNSRYDRRIKVNKQRATQNPWD